MQACFNSAIGADLNTLSALVPLLATNFASNARSVSLLNDEKLLKLKKAFAPYSDAYREFLDKYCRPMLYLEAKSFDNYLEAKEKDVWDFFSSILMKFQSDENLSPGRMHEMASDIFYLTDQWFKEIKSLEIYDDGTLRDFKEAVFLELNNEVYFMEKVSKDSFVGVIEVLSSSGLNLQKFLSTSLKLYMVMFALFEASRMPKGEIQRDTIHSLAASARYLAEEKDAQISSIDLLFDKQKSKDLEESILEYKTSKSRKE